jgi:hypothetical protein
VPTRLTQIQVNSTIDLQALDMEIDVLSPESLKVNLFHLDVTPSPDAYAYTSDFHKSQPHMAAFTFGVSRSAFKKVYVPG